MFKLNAKFDADSLLYSFRHSECDGHTVHMLTQQRPQPPLTSTVRLSLFMHVHPSPLSLAGRLHPYHANHSCFINNDWTFSGEISFSQKWDRWVKRQIHFYFFDVSPYCFPKWLHQSAFPPMVQKVSHFLYILTSTCCLLIY